MSIMNKMLNIIGFETPGDDYEDELLTGSESEAAQGTDDEETKETRL